MQDRLDKIFYQEVREKKTTASGVHGKKGKRGHVGKMVTPADLSGREYKESRDLPSYNIYEFLSKLNETPTLKSVLLARMDEEHQNYRKATEKTLDAVAELIRMGIEPVYQELYALRRQVEILSTGVSPAEVNPDDLLVPAVPSSLNVVKAKKKRIRWGSDEETIRDTVFAQLDDIVAADEEISTETIKQRVPSMLRWIYGQRAIFDGIEGLRREYLAGGRQSSQAVNNAATETENESLEAGSGEREALQA